MRYEYVPNQIRMIQLEDFTAPDFEFGNIAIIVCELKQELDRIGAQLSSVSQQCQ